MRLVQFLSMNLNYSNFTINIGNVNRMALEKTDFVPLRDQEERDKDKTRVFSIRLNDEELKALEDGALVIGQEKLTTAIKQFAAIGLIVLHDSQTSKIMETLFINKKRNERTGIFIPEPKFKKL